MKDQEWIKALKPGDRVIVEGNYGSETIRTVEKITPTGRIVLNDAETYNPDGFRRGDGLGWSRNLLREATPERIAEVEHDALASKIGSKTKGEALKWSLAKLRTVWAAIEADDPDAKGDA